MLNLRRAPARFLAAPIAGAALFAAVPADAQDAHGVIAFGETDQGKGVAYGFSWNFQGKEAAHAEAVNACTSSGGADCVQLAWFQNGCGALAIDQYGNAQGKPGMSLEQAEARALRTCEAAGGGGCNVVGSICAAPGGEPGTWSGSEGVLPAHGSQTTATGPEDESLTREERIRVQQSLTALGFDAGPADGVFGRRTRSAIWEWQNANGLEATGHVTREQFASITAADASPTEEREPEPQQETTDARNYNACMEHCTKEGRDFDHCHPICSNSTVTKPSAAVPAAGHSAVTKPPIAVPVAGQGNCTTLDEKMDAIERFILENYGRQIYLTLSLGPTDKYDQFKVYFYPGTQRCEGIFSVDMDCRIGDAEGNFLANDALRERSISCRLDPG